MSRGFTAFFASCVVLAVIAIGADLVVTDLAEDAASERVSAVLGAPSDVTLHGWPVSVRLLAGAVPEARITATDVPLEASPVTASTLAATLTDVRVRFADLRGPEGTLPVRAQTGTFVATFDEAAVTTLLQELTGGAPIALEEGVMRATVAGIPVTATVAVDGADLLLMPTGPGPIPAELRVPLPTLPAGARIDRLSVQPDALRVEGTVAGLTGPAAGEVELQ